MASDKTLPNRIIWDFEAYTGYFLQMPTNSSAAWRSPEWSCLETLEPRGECGAADVEHRKTAKRGRLEQPCTLDTDL